MAEIKADEFEADPFAGLLAGAAVVAPFVLSSFRDNRRFDENAPLPMPKALADPLPPVLEFTPPEQEMPATMMGLQPVEGDRARRVKIQRGGLAAGPDVTSPNIINPLTNTSAIDGKPMVDLNGKYVTRLQQEEVSPKDAGTPSFDMAT